LRKSQRVYLTEKSCDLDHKDDPVSFKQTMSRNSSQWLKIVNDEMKCMEINEVWDYKTKIDSQDSIERYKARLVAKRFTQQQEVHYDNTFSSVSKKDSL
jgi:Reverse transcriptase (RNA-dependent DNA polymerase)